MIDMTDGSNIDMGLRPFELFFCHVDLLFVLCNPRNEDTYVFFKT